MITKMSGPRPPTLVGRRKNIDGIEELLKINFNFKYSGINNESFQTIERNRTKYLTLINRTYK